MGVVGGVEEILTVEFAEDERLEDVTGGDGALGIGFLDGLETGEGAVVVEVVEAFVGLADLWGEVDGVGVGGGIIGVRDDWGCQQKRDEKEVQGFDGAFYCSSPKPVTLVVLSRIFLPVKMIG